MTPKLRPPFALLVSLVIAITLVATDAASAAGKKAAKKSAPAPAKKGAKAANADRNSRHAKGREQAAAKKSSKKETRAERRQREREESAERGGKSGRASKRERLAAARREAEERRRRAEAEERRRRAEAARQAAIARQRALDEAIRNEVQQNILRDDPTGEDPEVRRVAVAALGRAAGTVVVMNPKTGQIYTIVNQQWGVRRGFKPCSTTKLITGLAGLGEGVIDPIAENVSYGNHPTLTSALARSAPNSYFQQVGRKVGFERMVSYARQLGLGERTGINHAGEFPGRLPLFKNDVGMLRMSSHGDDIEVTAVQLASLASVFATGGTLVTPHLPRTPEENLKFRTEVRRQLNIPQENLRRMLVAMVGAVNYGSARKTYDPAQTIAGKTGTCIDTDRTAWVGLFTSFAPVEDPQLAVAVITRGTDARKHLPVAVANQIYRALSYRFGKRGARPAFQLTSPDLVAPRPALAAPAIAEADDDVDEAEADAREELNGGAAPAAPTLTAPAAGVPATNGSVRPVLMPIPQEQRPVLSAPAPASTQPQRGSSTGGDRPRRVPNNEQQ